MTIQKGDTLPGVILKKKGDDGIDDIDTSSYFKNKKVVLFGVPGAFTPPCTEKHLPGYIEKADEIKSNGVDEIICVAVNDPFVVKKWEEVTNVDGKITMLSDGNNEFVQAMGLTFDGSGLGLGTRSRRFSMIVENGVVVDVETEEKPSDVELTSAATCLAKL